MSEVRHYVIGMDAAGINHGKDYPDTPDGRWEAEQYRLRLLRLAKAGDAQGQPWQVWPTMEGRETLGAPVKQEARYHEPVRKPQRRRPYDD